MKVLKALIRILVLVALALAVTAAVARFQDGPIAMFPGGPLVAGEPVTTEVSTWTFADAAETIELQLEGEKTSRTVWILVDDGLAYIPCSLGFPPGKTWYERANLDGRATVRIGGRLYPVTLRRVRDAAVEAHLGELVDSKYGSKPPGNAGVWYFSMKSRSPDEPGASS
jgi:hypothetical protein